jgi:hypothetical protein
MQLSDDPQQPMVAQRPDRLRHSLALGVEPLVALHGDTRPGSDTSTNQKKGGCKQQIARVGKEH